MLEGDPSDARHLIAAAVHFFAVLSHDIPSADAFRRLERHLPSLAGDEGLAASRFHVVRSLAWWHALSGRYSNAMKFVFESMREARRQTEQLNAYLDHAMIAVFANEQRSPSAIAAYAAAVGIFDTIEWPSILTAELAVLPLAAQVAAEFGAFDDAKRFCRMAATISRGRRYGALVSEATALTYANADRRRSIAAAADAYQTYESFGFTWRAARMAILLLRLTRAEAWRSRAIEQLRECPDGPFHRRLERPHGLTRRQEDVLQLVRLGYDDARIAEELGVSYKTVRIHIGSLFRWYGVRNRSALMAKAGTLGVDSPQL
ncbi:MAG TPA: LuxR C-terminal-related transcriptional regulator [Candidatus Baltobacteraceae bacterium]|nr:LuxR C-terminal-related transcriptional regulator [Candidatus Baltobacteraceae bacterium]